MTREEKALIYFKDLRERKVKDYSSVLDIAPKGTVVYEAVSAEIEIYDTAIKALEQENWIPVSERLPKNLEPVNITWVNHNPESYYADIKDKPFTATGVYFNGQWYWWSTLCTDILAEYSHNYDDIIDDNIEITAWQPLPEPYKAESEVKG